MMLTSRRIDHSTMHITVSGRVVRMAGVMREAEVSSWFNPIIDELHEEAVRARVPEVVLDLRALEYANAALWKCLVVWLKKARDERDPGYSVRILTEPSYQWQQVGMSALRVFGGDRLVVERGPYQEAVSH
jgi:hypothetical protein